MSLKLAFRHLIMKSGQRSLSEADSREDLERKEQVQRFFKVVIIYFACPAMLVMWFSDGIYQAHSAGQMFVIRVIASLLMIPTCLIAIRQKTFYWTQVWATISGCCGYFSVHLIYYLRGDPNSHFVYALMPAIVIVATGIRLNWFFYFLNCSLIYLPTFCIGLLLDTNEPKSIFLVDMMNWVLTISFCTSGRWFFEKIFKQEQLLRSALKTEASEREFLLAQAINDLIAGNRVSNILVEKVPTLIPQWEALMATLQEYKNKEAEGISSRRLADLARQVAHDIRSPLSALSMMTEILSEIPEEKRLIVKTAAVRINDIANELLSRSVKVSISDSEAVDLLSISETLMLPAIVDQLASEKRAQYGNKRNIKIETSLGESFGAFIVGQNREIMRLLSNLVDNAVESMPDGGVVKIIIATSSDSVKLCIDDNGKGIPPEILKDVGDRGFSFGKNGGESGAGLGVFHAKSLTQSMGGKFEIRSKVGIGTSVEIVLKKADAPNWFLEEMVLCKTSQIVIIDDDQSIHQLWKSRLREVVDDSVQMSIVNFTSPLEFEEFVSSQELSQDFLYLVDFELLASAETGVDLITRLRIEQQSILVTSHWDESQIRAQCESRNIKLLPKSLAGFVPLRFVSTN